MKQISTLTRKIKELQGGLSNRAFAELCGISEGAVRSIKGGGNPTTKTLEKIAEATKVDINDFFKPPSTATNSQKISVSGRTEIHADRCGDITMQSNTMATNAAGQMMEVTPREKKILSLIRQHFSNARLLELEDELDDLEQAHRQRRLKE